MSDISAGAAFVPSRPARTIGQSKGYQSIVNAVFVIFMFCGSISLIEPSPYDFAALVAIPLWFFGGFKVSPALTPVIVMWIVFNLGGFIALMPHWGDTDAMLFQFQSLYLIVTVIFFTIFFSQNTHERLALCLKGFTAGCIFCSMVGIAGYFDIGGTAAYATMYEGRLSGTFKDPNVLGSYLILSAVYLMQMVVLGTTKRYFWSILWLMMIMIVIFLSFSRGSWGATFVALVMMIGMAFVTARSPKERQRIVLLSIVGVGVAMLAIIIVLADQTTRDLLFLRASVTQDYDVGETGRFGNQLRSLPLLLELPNGFGPLRFRLVFGLEPHNSYINAFASYGWLGGFTWLALVGTSCWIGFRLCFSPSPYRRIAQVYFPTLFVLLMQGFQIDIDHWRQVFLCFGAVWGMEAARLKWMRDQRRAGHMPAPRLARVQARA